MGNYLLNKLLYWLKEKTTIQTLQTATQIILQTVQT
jgi:hypothetical protein